MNRIREIRVRCGLSQQDVVARLRETIPVMDIGLYSKIECGHCLPTQETLSALTSILQAPVALLYDDGINLPQGKHSGSEIYAACRKTIAEYLADYIPEGRENAIPRKDLARLIGISDRSMRRLIEHARRGGAIIINDQTGRGYYRTDDASEIKRQRDQLLSRAMILLEQVSQLNIGLRSAEKDGHHV